MSFSATFLKDLVERAAKTAAQAAVAALALPAADVYSLSAWKGAAITAVAAGLSVLFSVLSKGLADPNTASAVNGITTVQ